MESARKRQRIEPVEDPLKQPEQWMLQYQNSALAAKLNDDRRVIAGLNRRVETLESDQTKHESVVSFIEARWNQLYNDLQLIMGRLDPSLLTSFKTERPQDGSLLHALLQANENSNLAQIDATLQRKCKQVSDLFTSLVQAVYSGDAKFHSLFQMMKVPSEHSLNDTLRKENDQLRANLSQLQSGLDRLHVQNRDAVYELSTLRNKLDSQEKKMSELKYELEDKSVALERANRHLHQLKNEKGSGLLGLFAPKKPGTDTSSSNANQGTTQATSATTATSSSSSNGPNGSSTSGGGTQNDALSKEIEDLKVMCESRLAEIHKLSEEKKEMLGALDKLKFELIVSEERFHTSQLGSRLKSDMELLLKSNQTYKDVVERLQSQLAETQTEYRNKLEKLETSEVNRRQLLERQSEELRKELVAVKIDRDNLTGKVSLLEGAMDKSGVVRELKQTLDAATTEIANLKNEVSRLHEQLSTSRSQCDRAKQEREDVTTRLRAKESECLGLLDRMEKSQDASKHESVNGSVDPKSVRQLEHQIEVKGEELGQLKQTIEDLNSELAGQREQGDALISEIESLGKALEDLQEQNRRVIQELSEKDDSNTKLMQERIRAQQMQSLLQKEKATLEMKLSALQLSIAKQAEYIAKLEQQLRFANEQTTRAQEEVKLASQQNDSHKRQVTDLQKHIEELKNSVDKAKTAFTEAQNVATKHAQALEDDKVKLKRLEEKNVLLQRKLDRFPVSQDSGDGTSTKDVIEYFASMVKCKVCNERNKEVVLAKCYHTFCAKCIERNLETRHRKCPGCGLRFGADDVKKLYLDFELM
eukprot:GILK01006307.1.p1 GENE.GILK01006307.1~~GILK01006307.1.p1  ORF type:complete len:816 (-),score=195.11 GILK01006307.1:398-2845(-)